MAALRPMGYPKARRAKQRRPRQNSVIHLRLSNQRLGQLNGLNIAGLTSKILANPDGNTIRS